MTQIVSWISASDSPWLPGPSQEQPGYSRFKQSVPAFWSPSDRGEEKEQEKYRRWRLTRSLPSRVSPPEFQTQPRTHHIHNPHHPSSHHVSCLILAYPSFRPLLEGTSPRVPGPNGGMKILCSNSSFGIGRKGLGTHARDLGSRRWSSCPLRTRTSQNLLITMRSFFNNPSHSFSP